MSATVAPVGALSFSVKGLSLWFCPVSARMSIGTDAIVSPGTTTSVPLVET